MEVLKCSVCSQDLLPGAPQCPHCSTPAVDNTSRKMPSIPGYDLIGFLGKGGMGQVFLATDQILGRRVAIKMISEESVQDTPTKNRFLREARLMATVEHSNVVRVYGFGTAEGKYYLVMEYVEGSTIYERIRKEGRLSVKDAISIVGQIVEGLEAGWEKQIIHRDVKPSNIFLDKRTQARIGDFGLAKPVHLKGSTLLTQTQSGVLVGTPAYSSPEQIQGIAIDFRSDIYSLGIVFYEMLAGKPPFVASTPMALLSEHLRTPLPSIRRIRPEVSKSVEGLLQWMTQKDAARRPSSYSELHQVIESLSSEKHDQKTIFYYPHLVWRVFSAQNKRKALYVGLVIAFLIGFAALYFRKPPQTRVRAPDYRQITYLGDVKNCSLSPDGNYVAFVQNQKLFVQELAGGKPIQIYEGKDIQLLRWSPDSSKLLFKNYSEATSTVIISKLGGTPQIIPLAGISCWSPDGSTIARWDLFQDQSGKLRNAILSSLSPDKLNIVHGLADKGIHLLTLATGARSNISLPGNFDWLIDVDWSSNGKLLYLIRYDNAGKDELWTITPDGKQSHKIHEQRILTISSPRWNSSGDSVYFLDNSSTLSRVLKIRIDQKTGGTTSSFIPLVAGLETLEPGIENPIQPAFSYSTDAKRIAFLRYTWHSNLQSVTLNQSPGDTKNDFSIIDLIKGTRQISFPRLSPDGSQIAYSSGESGKAIFVMPSEGMEEQQLTFMRTRSTSPAWSPDGNQIAFASGGKIWRIRVNGTRLFQYKNTQPSPEYPDVIWAPCLKLMYLGPANKMYYVVDPDTGNESPLFKLRENQWVFDPVCSPNGEKVAVRIKRLPEPGEGLWVINLSNMSEKMLKKGPVYPLKWSKDGSWIYVADNGKLAKISPLSGDQQEITNFPFTGIDKSWIDVAPDERQFAVAARSSQSDVWIIDNFDPDLQRENKN